MSEQNPIRKLWRLIGPTSSFSRPPLQTKKVRLIPFRGPVLEVDPLKCGVRVSLASIIM